MPPPITTNPKNKTILINVSIVAALIYMHYTGSPALIVVGAGIFLLVMANLLMMFVARKHSKSPE